jgi:hypothetical protein
MIGCVPHLFPTACNDRAVRTLMATQQAERSTRTLS